VTAAEAAVNGNALTQATIQAAARALEGALDDAPGDLHASAAYRRSLAGALLERALTRTL
jgi:carbon-monoxide dehydrogenase medium subunit